ncbi:hypothetical protein B5F77_06025 [Parabacteroides sp. An277]|uniref:sialate O-acetylesterase n=1 Tax=Parabacteroides sp. An277 TaxID=1965619 RepID=UPI000B3AED9F|nr:sialate O-acetylesterase [Parabacteroides sp. An277]OUO53353.1 hypothetical protein B5F77_06025 [Parabacteroides sp. An277]
MNKMGKWLGLGVLTFMPLWVMAEDEHLLRKQILDDAKMAQVEEMAREVVAGGFNAGDGYGEVWIRDYNTFIELAMEVMPDEAIRENLNTFFHFQGKTGDIVDGFIDIRKADLDNVGGYKYRLSETEKRFAAHKNTVETDHETSLIQAIYKYVKRSGNRAYLQTTVAGKTVLERMEWALEYLMNEKYNTQYGLLIGATTADWGDVQPEHPWGVEIDENTHLAIDIYDNAMMVLALNNYLELIDDANKKARWTKVRDELKANIRKYLWDEEHEKYIPHIYLNGSPFSAKLDENRIYYQGGTTIAILAGLHSADEIKVANQKMLENQRLAHAQTIGVTMYPTYPAGSFQGVSMYPYGYQNGGDWTWFGGRMIQALVANGLVEEAYAEIQPMLQRILVNKGFYEWYTPGGEPQGSGTFRGEAGVLFTAIEMLRDWAEQDSLPLEKADDSLVLFTFGQSNSANHGQGRYQPRHTQYNYFEGKLYPASDPLIGATGEGGSVWTRVGDKLVEAGMAKQVTLVPIGVGGVRIGAWAKGDELYGKLVRTVEQMKQDGIKPDYILWHQGETDNILNTSTEEYVRLFETIREVFRSRGIDAPIVIAQVSYHPNCLDEDNGKSETIRQAQKQLADKYEDIYLGPDTDRLDKVWQRADGIHFSEPGQELHAEMWRDALKAIR